MSKQVLMNKQQAIELIDDGLQYILGDLQTLSNNKEHFPMSFPQILLAFSGMEFLAALLYSNSIRGYTHRIEKFIMEWMPESYNRNEGNTSLGRFLYDSLRSGLVHYGNVKGDIVVDHDENALRHHLSWIEYEGKRRLFIHGYQFAADFRTSVEAVKEAIEKGSIELDSFQSNAGKLETELKSCSKRDPQDRRNTESSLDAWLNGNNHMQLDPGTAGTTFIGGH